MLARPRPHDLLWLNDRQAWQYDPERPDWLDTCWHTMLPVVVRREQTASPHIAVGIRGHLRSQRHAQWVEPAAICRVVSPEQLAAGHVWRQHPHFRQQPALQALQQLQPWLDDMDAAWGITGSAGFELASGWPALGPDSDLDLLLRTPHPPSTTALHQLVGRTQKLGCRVDIQLETPAGGVALQEWLRGGKVMVKTGSGPRLLRMPWNVEAAQ